MTKPQCSKTKENASNSANECKETEKSPRTAKDLFSVFAPNTSSDEDEEPSPKKAKESKRYIQKYKKEWEDRLELKPWLSESILGNTFFYCKFCKKDYRCGISDINKHMSSKKHISNNGPANRQKLFTFRGMLCPVFTPFLNNNRLLPDVKIKAIAKYSSFLMACGVKGVLINDIIGEGMSLTLRERLLLTETWLENCKRNSQFLIVQIGGAPLKDVVEMAKHAANNKVGAIAILPDLHHRPSNHLDLIKYLKIISEFTKDIPILYHHHPQFVQVKIDMTAFLIEIIGEIDSFVGLIYTTNDLAEIQKATIINTDKFTVFVGTDRAILGSISSGFDCIMSSTLNFLPKLVEGINSCLLKEKLKEAQTTQNLLNKTIDDICKFGDWIPASKAAMEIMTNICGLSTRAPLETIWEGNTKKLEIKLQELGLV